MTTTDFGARSSIAFVERNPGWSVNDAALGSVTVVDQFACFLRRARAAPHSAASTAALERIGAEDAALAARWLREKATPTSSAFLITSRCRSSITSAPSRPKTRTRHRAPSMPFASRLKTFSMKGYEAFHEVENEADVDVFIDDDGTPSGVANVSKIHPRLAIEHAGPALAEDDARLCRGNVLGRRVFALGDDDQKIELGVVETKDLLSSGSSTSTNRRDRCWPG